MNVKDNTKGAAGTLTMTFPAVRGDDMLGLCDGRDEGKSLAISVGDAEGLGEGSMVGGT